MIPSRTKVSSACSQCCLRRTKCTGELPSCKYCLKVGIECVYQPTVKRGPKKGAKYKARVNKKLDPLNTSTNTDSLDSPNSNSSQQQHNRIESTSSSIASTSTLPALCAVASASESADSPPQQIKTNNKRPRLSDSNSSNSLNKLSHISPPAPLPLSLPSQSNSNNMTLQQQQQNSQQQQHQHQQHQQSQNQQQQNQQQNQFHIPNLSSEVLHHLIPIFFSHVNYQGFSILHEPSFLLALQENKVGPALLYAISAAASAFSTHPAVQLASVPGGPTSNSGIVWAVASRKCLLAQVDSQFTLQGVQTLAILSAWELAQGCGETAWVDIGTAMRAAQIMGFDDGSELEAVYDGPIPQTEIALRQRIVWTLFSLEVILGFGARSISLLGGVASSVALESLPLPMLGNWEKGTSHHQHQQQRQSNEFGTSDSDDEEEEIPTLFVGGGRIMHSLSVVGVEPFLCRIFEIYARLNRFLNLTRITNASAKIRRLSVPIVNRHFPMAIPKDGARDWDPASPFAKLSLDLSTWSMHLPTPFAFNATTIVSLSTAQLSSFYTMHLIYHLGQVALHRPYLSDFRYQTRQFPPPIATDGYSVFVNSCHRKAAVHAISLARVLVSATKHASFAISPLAGYCAFTGATALLFDADMRGSSAASQALQFFLRFLLTGADFYSSLRPFHACLSTLIALHQSVHPEPSHSPPPRTSSDIVPDFFSRYEAYGIKEPLLAPVLIRGPNTPRQELPHQQYQQQQQQQQQQHQQHQQQQQNQQQSNASGLDRTMTGTTPSAEVDGYLSHLREILAAVEEENWDDDDSNHNDQNNDAGDDDEDEDEIDELDENNDSHMVGNSNENGNNSRRNSQSSSRRRRMESPALSIARSTGGNQTPVGPLPSLITNNHNNNNNTNGNNNNNNNSHLSNSTSNNNLPFTSQYDPFLPIPAASPLNLPTPSAETPIASGNGNNNHLVSGNGINVELHILPSRNNNNIPQSPYSFNHHNPNNKIVNYDPYPSSNNISNSNNPLTSSNSNHILSHHLNDHNNNSTNQNQSNHLDSPINNNNNNAEPQTPDSRNNPADIFTWLFSEPVAETIWDDQALEGFLGVADWPLYPENGN